MNHYYDYDNLVLAAPETRAVFQTDDGTGSFTPVVMWATVTTAFDGESDPVPDRRVVGLVSLDGGLESAENASNFERYLFLGEEAPEGAI